jgi:long-chain acyl-CoA synthetase
VVELEPGADCEEEELVDLVRSHIAGYKKPRSIVFVEALPRAGGGVDRAEVKREWGGSKTDE